MIEVLKQARKAFEVATTPLAKDRQEVLEAVAAINQAIAELESQEPDVVRLSNGTFDVIGSKIVPLGALLYLHPPQRTWVGLTDEQMLECNMDGDLMIDRETAKRNVEAKLKEKNT
jgi:hypothetical protein